MHQNFYSLPSASFPPFFPSPPSIPFFLFSFWLRLSYNVIWVHSSLLPQVLYPFLPYSWDFFFFFFFFSQQDQFMLGVETALLCGWPSRVHITKGSRLSYPWVCQMPIAPQQVLRFLAHLAHSMLGFCLKASILQSCTVLCSTWWPHSNKTMWSSWYYSPKLPGPRNHGLWNFLALVPSSAPAAALSCGSPVLLVRHSCPWPHSEIVLCASPCIKRDEWH